MSVDAAVEVQMMRPDDNAVGEQQMIDQERWQAIRRRHFEDKVTISALAREFDLNRRTIRRSLRQPVWQPYQRPPVQGTLLESHAQFLRERAAQVGYSARILFQELKALRGYMGSYETVKRFVAPLRELQVLADGTITRFETPPGHQSQIDWGQVKVFLGAMAYVLHLFVLTLGFSRRGFYYACPDERLGQFLEAHERAFEHFGGHTREHLYDRPRTVCYADGGGRRIWNPTFKAFADYWGFEPRVCRPYRAQTKGKVESGVKYVKRNFLPGRRFVDIVDFQAQLDEWNATIADQRIHGTTHEQPIVRFAREQAALVPLASQRSFNRDARVSRIVALDYLVSFETNRYSVPFQLIGQTVEVQRDGVGLHIFHRDRLIVTHPLLSGKHELRIVPEHGPGAAARNARLRRSTLSGANPIPGAEPDVEVRDLALYDALIPSIGAAEVTQ